MILVEVGGSMQGYMEAHGSFHGIYSWKLQLMEAMETPTSIAVNLLPPTSMDISMEVGGKFHRSRSSGSRWTLILWKELEVCDTRGNRWKYVGVY